MNANTQQDFGFGAMPITRDWSHYQLDVFKFMEGGRGNGRIDAVAGSGKTTTGVEGIRRIMLGRNVIALAFNVTIKDELLRRGVPARTFHSVGWGALVRTMPGAAVEERKLYQLMRESWEHRERKIYDDWCHQLVGLAKNHGIGAMVEDQPDRWIELIEHFGLDFEPGANGFDPEEALDLARQLLAESVADTTRVDYNDQLYLAIRHNLRLPTFDVVVVDEAQDTNPVRREIVRRVLRANGRLFAIGDPNQAIYGFTGADADAMDLITQDFDCTHLPLSICYRCGTSIVEHAQQWVPHIEAAPGAHAGTIEMLGDRWDFSDFKPGNFIVCRVNAPLFGLAMRLLRERVPVHIHGREIGQGLKAAIRKTGAHDVPAMIARLREATTKEMQKAQAKDQPLRAQNAWDRYQAIVHISDDCRSVEDVYRVIDELFRDKAVAVQLATIHKSKGLEFDTVYWLQPPLPWVDRLTGWQAQQERNLKYVATTRARNRLAIITPRIAE